MIIKQKKTNPLPKNYAEATYTYSSIYLYIYYVHRYGVAHLNKSHDLNLSIYSNSMKQEGDLVDISNLSKFV